MRILTPAELRQLQSVKDLIIKCYGNYAGVAYCNEDDVVIILDDDNRELWLNILDMALKQNEAMKISWQENIRIGNSTAVSNIPSEVLNKLRPNG